MKDNLQCSGFVIKERCIMVRIKDGNYIAIFHDRMIEVKADSKKMLIIKQKIF